MKKAQFILILIAVAVVGFALGRATGGVPAATLENVHKEFPLFPAPPKAADAPLEPQAPPKPEKNVIVESPLDGDRPVQPTFDVSGRAKAGQPVHIAVTAADGAVLVDTSSPVQAAADEPFGRFSYTVTLDPKPTAPVTVSVWRDGEEADKISRTVVFGASDQVSVKVYFSNDKLAGEGACDVVYPVERTVSGSDAIYASVLDELLKGPNADDVAQGYATSIPGSVKLKSTPHADADGVVTADFDARLARGVVAGSCRAQAVRAQIAATLKQFPEVHDVVISVDGRTEGVLQP